MKRRLPIGILGKKTLPVFALALILLGCPGAPDSVSNPLNDPPAAAGTDSDESSPPETARPADTLTSDTLIDSIFKAHDDLSAGIPPGSILGLIRISSQDEEEGWFAEEQLIFLLVQSGMYRVVERRELDIIRDEQNFHLSGEVDDETAVSIGRMAGAGIVITGSILPYGPVRFLNLRALDVETAQIRAVSSRPFAHFF